MELWPRAGGRHRVIPVGDNFSFPPQDRHRHRRQRQRQNPLNGRRVAYTYDDDGRVDGHREYAADGTSLVKTTRFSFDDANPGQATLFELQNEFGQLAEVKTTAHDGAPLAYTYDDATRLVSVTAAVAPGRNETFTLDAASNRLAHSRTGTAAWRYDEANQLKERPSAAGTIRYEYDAAGNQTRKTDTSLPEPQRTTHFEYDAFNRLVAVRDGAGSLIATYTHDPFDRRLSKTLGNGARTTYLHSPWGLLAEADSGGAVQVSYGWNPLFENSTAPLFARVPDGAGGQRYLYFHNDHLGTPQRITDKAGTLVWAAEYDAYGRASVRSTSNNPVINNLRFPGQYLDAETGLHYNNMRSYDPDTGRYITRDPIGFEGGINLYAYARGNPVSYVDPDGRFAVNAGLAGLGAVIGGVSGLVGAVQKCGSWREVAGATAMGALFGATAGATLGFAGSVGVGAAAGFGGDLSGTLVGGGQVNLGDSAMAGVIGGMTGGAGALLGKIGVSGRMSNGITGIVGGMLGLQYNKATGAVDDSCTCKK